MSDRGFNPVVAARTRTAVEIRDNPKLLHKLIEVGGLPRDLDGIIQTGIAAEAADLAQSRIKSSGKVATLGVSSRFAALQKEYSSVMGVAVVRAR
jgi:hypothetical protein